MLPYWIRSRNCSPRLVYFFAMEITRRRFASIISFLARAPVPFATRNGHVDATELGDRQAGIGRHGGDLSADLGDVVRMLDDEHLPALAGKAADPVEPVWIEFGPAVVLQEVLAADLAAFGHPHELAFQRGQPLVQQLQLADQFLDAVVVQPNLTDLFDQLLTGFFVTFFGAHAHFLASGNGLQPAVLHLVQLALQVLDFLEVRQNLGFQFLFQRGQTCWGRRPHPEAGRDRRREAALGCETPTCNQGHYHGGFPRRTIDADRVWFWRAITHDLRP
jgi:hypothetical protein